MMIRMLMYVSIASMRLFSLEKTFLLESGWFALTMQTVVRSFSSSMVTVNSIYHLRTAFGKVMLAAAVMLLSGLNVISE